MKLILKSLVIMFCAVILIGQTGLAMALKVAPHRLVFRIDQPDTITQVVIVTNTSDKPIRVKVYPEMAPDQLKEEYMGEWIVVYPRILSLKPGEKKFARFTVRVPGEVKDGEYRSLLFFEELPQQQEDKDKTEGIELNFQLLTKLGINIYGQYGKIIHRGNMESTALEIIDGQLLIKGNFINQGNAHLLMEAKVMVMDSQGQIVAESEIPLFAVHRSVSRNFSHQLPFQGSGLYTLKIIFKQEDVIIDEYTREFKVANQVD